MPPPVPPPGASHTIEAQWKGCAGSVLLRRATLACVAFAREHGTTGWIVEDRLLDLMRPVDLEWTTTYPLHLLVKMGL